MQEQKKKSRLRDKEGVFSRVIISLLFTIPFLCLSPLGSNAVHAAQVTLSWSPNTESDIAGYRVSYGTSSGSYATTVDIGNMSSCTLDGLQAGQTYYFAAKAYNTAKLESSYSNEISYTTPVISTKKERSKSR